MSNSFGFGGHNVAGIFKYLKAYFKNPEYFSTEYEKKNFQFFNSIFITLYLWRNNNTSSDNNEKTEVEIGSDSSPNEECLSDDSVETSHQKLLKSLVS